MAMLVVETSNFSEQQRLQQQYKGEDGIYQVPFRQTTTIATLLKAIPFEIFHAEAPPLLKKLQQFALRSLSGVCSLDLYREAIQVIQKEIERCNLYQEYIVCMNQAFEEAPLPLAPLLSTPHSQNLEELFEKVKGEEHSPSLLQLEVPMLRLDSGRECEEVQSKHTISTGVHSRKETLGGGARLANFFYSPSAVYSREEWRTQRSGPKESSREIDSFRKRTTGVLETNTSLQCLIASELAYDLKRQAVEESPLKRELDQRKQKEEQYRRKMKDALIFSKLCPRKRK